MNWSELVRYSSFSLSFLVNRERMFVMACFVKFNVLAMPEGEIPILVNQQTFNSVSEKDGLSPF